MLVREKNTSRAAKLPAPTMTPPNPRKKSIYTNSSVQVLFAVAAAVALGCLRPATAVALKPLGGAFLRLLTLTLRLVVFWNLGAGRAAMANFKKSCAGGGK